MFYFGLTRGSQCIIEDIFSTQTPDLEFQHGRQIVSSTSKVHFPTYVRYFRSSSSISSMAKTGRAGRRRKRRRNSIYCSEHGRTVTEAEYITLLKWAKRNRISFGKLRPAYFSATGRGLMTCKKLNSGDLVISVPEEMLITAKTAEQSDIGKRLIKLRPKPLLMLCVFILYEKHLGKSSLWHPYISTLPRSFNTPAYFNDEELNALPSSLSEQCTTQINTVHESYEDLKASLESCTGILEKTFLDNLTFDEFRWAWFVVNTRSVYKAGKAVTSMVAMGTLQTENAYALAPVLDLLNHTDTAEVYIRRTFDNLRGRIS